MPVRTYQTRTAQVTTNDFVDVALTDPAGPGSITVMLVPESHLISGSIQNPDGANAIDWQLLGSNDRGLDDADWSVEDSGATIAAGAADSFKLLPYFLYYKLQVKATVGGSQGDIIATIAAK